MKDSHIHLERGPYTDEWLDRFVDHAVKTGMDEIWLLEHSYLFPEFVPMYDGILGRSRYVDDWFRRKAGKRSLPEYLDFAERSKERDLPVKLRFGLEVCYFENSEKLVREHKDKFDFLVGSVHFVDGFAFDHAKELLDNVDVDRGFRRFFETSLSLAESGLFDGVAHPDSIKLFGHRPSFDLTPYYDSLAAALERAGMYAEQNSGISRRTDAEAGMSAGLLAAMKRHGVRIMTASDAHCPEDVGKLALPL